jgi:hypothetical protein
MAVQITVGTVPVAAVDDALPDELEQAAASAASDTTWSNAMNLRMPNPPTGDPCSRDKPTRKSVTSRCRYPVIGADAPEVRSSPPAGGRRQPAIWRNM